MEPGDVTSPDRVIYVSFTDQELATQYRSEMILALQTVMNILGRARKDGLILGFTLGVDQFGRDIIAGNGITVARYL